VSSNRIAPDHQCAGPAFDISTLPQLLKTQALSSINEGAEVIIEVDAALHAGIPSVSKQRLPTPR